MIDIVHRAKHRQLWIDKVRAEMDGLLNPETLERNLKFQCLWEIYTGRHDTPTPHESAAFVERLKSRLVREAAFAAEGLDKSLPEAAIAELKERGWSDNRAAPKVDCAAGWCAESIVLSPATRIMLLDDRTAEQVIGSNNEPLTAAELQFLPHNPCLVEFHRPVEICPQIKRGVRARAVGFYRVDNDVAPAAVVVWYLDYKQTLPETGIAVATKLIVWFGIVIRGTMDRAAGRALGVELGTDLQERITKASEKAARNVLDFVTMRAIKYERIKRKAANYPPARPMHTQGLRSSVDREVFRLYIENTMRLPIEQSNGQPHPPRWGYRVEVPGKFHQLIYCGKCGDLHRHDLIGCTCRKCGNIVGPRSNIRIEKSWHPPYVVGPEHTPIKESVRDVRKKPVKT